MPTLHTITRAKTQNYSLSEQYLQLGTGIFTIGASVWLLDRIVSATYQFTTNSKDTKKHNRPTALNTLKTVCLVGCAVSGCIYAPTLYHSLNQYSIESLKKLMYDIGTKVKEKASSLWENE